MSPVRRLVASRTFWVAAMVALLALPIVRAMAFRPATPPPVLYPLPEFRFTDETGRPFGSRELRGKVYIANFIFTTCGDVCPRLSRKMTELQRRIRRARGALMLVSFSVDPVRDTPEVLRRYAASYQATPELWKFVTGPLGEIERAVVSGFKLPLSRPTPKGLASPAAGEAQQARQAQQAQQAGATGFFDIVHSDRLVLVDARGRIRGYYEATPEGMDAIVRAARAVLSERPGAS